MSDVKVAIMMGSESDAPVMGEAAKILQQFGVGCEMRVLSAHRTPKETVEYVEQFPKVGIQVAICGAGGSAALAGVVAAHTTRPVIGVPMDSMGLNGLDALLSTVQMPPGVPVGGVAIGKPGAKNAALLALRILALSDKVIERKLEDYREENRKKILGTKLSW
ncbi:MAG: 5-(carboxyamino)imidazole ribonucleotide mutase [Candidatus Omnitrophota bacterium]|nr:5-(carboxyamino)imidazole ribonucleotide mutase [Candidatus Omnitrophota bacterium]MDZ4241912.1 5-(carboxyamino)imidazole ribonucleotide mutase [Candidatus Omnitrophota bacterium]